MDYTGTGNSLNMRHPHVLQLIMDSLRYWVLEMHVDGFRFDLAAALARELHAVDRLSAFFDIIQQDPVISQVKLIAEPWDVGEGGYQVGNFPPVWTEWNGNFLATLLLSQGVAMLLGGDEIGRTQQGNNNAYCQDNPLSWHDWENADQELLIFNAYEGALTFTLPAADWGETWIKEFATDCSWPETEETFKAREQLKVEPRSLVVLRHAS